VVSFPRQVSSLIQNARGNLRIVLWLVARGLAGVLENDEAADARNAARLASGEVEPGPGSGCALM
jgi:hypothetical protein